MNIKKNTEIYKDIHVMGVSHTDDDAILLYKYIGKLFFLAYIYFAIMVPNLYISELQFKIIGAYKCSD